MKKYINFLCVLILALTFGDLILDFFFTTGKTFDHIDFDTLSLGSLLALLILVLVILGMGFMTLVYFIKFILNVNRNEVFCMKNVNLLRKYGTCVILIGVGLIILTLAIITESSFADALSDGIGALSEGFFALLMGEVFKIGLNLQEGKNVTA